MENKNLSIFNFCLLFFGLIIGLFFIPQSRPCIAAVIVPGSGFTGSTIEPPPVGSPSAFGYDAKAIARWDVVPYQEFSGIFKIGVVAFHMAGIDRVEFSAEGGSWSSVDTMTLNPQSGVKEYWIEINAYDFNDGKIEIRAIAYPKTGQPRLLNSLYLYANSNGTLTGNTIYISQNGSDSNSGTLASPMRTITYAIDRTSDGGKIIILDEGIFEVSSTSRRNAYFLNNERYITIEPIAGLDRNKVIVGWPNESRPFTRPRIGKIHYKNISMDFGSMSTSQYYLDLEGVIWFDNCRWFQAEGKLAIYGDSPVYPVGPNGEIYVTDSLAEDTLYGFVGVSLVRNSIVKNISGDAFSNTALIINSRIEDFTQLTDFHSDIWQIQQANGNNLIVYGLDSKNIGDVQCIFLDHYESTHTDYAIVDVNFDTTTSAGITQFNAAENHIILKNVKWGLQNFIFRTDFSPPKKFVGHNIIFENNQLSSASYNDYIVNNNGPSGVTFKNCYLTTPLLLGDVSNNNSLDFQDALMAAQHSLGLITLTSNQIALGDVSGDGNITAYDAALIILKIAGIINKFPIE